MAAKLQVTLAKWLQRGSHFKLHISAPSACPDTFQTGKDCAGASAAWEKTVATALLPKRQTSTQQREVQPAGKNVQSFLPKVCPVLLGSEKKNGQCDRLEHQGDNPNVKDSWKNMGSFTLVFLFSWTSSFLVPWPLYDGHQKNLYCLNSLKHKTRKKFPKILKT